MKEIIKNVYHVGDSGCSVYLVDTNSDEGLVLIDCGMDIEMIKSVSKLGLNSGDINHCFLTHFHIDHTAACSDLKNINSKVKFYAHHLDANAIEEKGHDSKTAASWYGVNYNPIKLERRLKGEKESIQLSDYNFQCIHTPGHTPGSISILVEVDKTKVLFGQDIHGPFYKSFGSNLDDYQKSMQTLLDLKADILCEGHFGVMEPAGEVARFIQRHKDMNRP
ncbi:MAG: MBL fold metallo-hydrolase [Promethearchaeota archaeon]|jgi:glyoxylase-like metal-dependent hydrolase (beta-lactamase superfamily II)